MGGTSGKAPRDDRDGVCRGQNCTLEREALEDDRRVLERSGAILVFGHSCLPVSERARYQCATGEALFTFAQPGKFLWGDEAKDLLTSLKEGNVPMALTKRAPVKWKDHEYDRGDIQLRKCSKHCPQYEYNTSMDESMERSTGICMGVWLYKKGETFTDTGGYLAGYSTTPGARRNTGHIKYLGRLGDSRRRSEGEKCKVRLERAFAIARENNVHMVIGVGCKGKC